MTSSDATVVTSAELVPPSVLAAFERRASADPDAVFVSTPTGESWTYGVLRQMVDVVRASIGDGPPGSIIGAYGGNDPQTVVALLATWKAGLALACCGRQLPPHAARPLFEMENCATVLAVETAPFESGPWRPVALPTSAMPVDGSWADGGARGAEVPLGAGPGRDDVACVCFTSGTTGQPKAIPLTHGHIVEHVARMAATPGRASGFRAGISAGRPLISFSPFGHNGFHSWLGLALWLGRGLVLVDKFSVDAAADVVARYSPSTLALTPTMVQMLASAPGDVSLTGVKYVTSSTAPLAPDVKEQFTARFGVPILQAYGMTELGNVAKEHLEDVVAGRQPRGSVGRVSPGREVKIVGDDGQPVAPGAEGNLLVRATGSSAPPTGLRLDADGWFDTGDRGALTDDSILTITGRSTDRIIVGGFNVSPAEVEVELRRTGLVSDAVVVGVPDGRLGEMPVAGVVWNGVEDQDSLRAALRDSLAHYKVPREFFAVAEVPRTAYGKIDRKNAAQQARRLLGREPEAAGAAGTRTDAGPARSAPGSRSALLVREIDGQILHVTLNRPERLNAVDRPMRAELVGLWETVKRRSDLRCIVVTGAGSRAFCVGMDLKSLVADGGFPEVPERLADHIGVNPLRHEVWTPLVVAVNGVCTGAGLQLVADGDVVVASTTASFLDTHVSVGQVSALEPIALAPRIGIGRTLKMCLLGKHGRIDAQEALHIGLVDELVAPEDLADRSLELARQFSEVSPNAARFTKQAIRMSTQLSQSEAEQFGWELLRRHRSHPDAMEGPRAFTEHRAPVWSAPWVDSLADHIATTTESGNG